MQENLTASSDIDEVTGILDYQLIKCEISLFKNRILNIESSEIDT